MITDNEIYKDLLEIKKKIELICKSENSEKVHFWNGILNEISASINKIKKDKRLFGW